MCVYPFYNEKITFNVKKFVELCKIDYVQVHDLFMWFDSFYNLYIFVDVKLMRQGHIQKYHTKNYLSYFRYSDLLNEANVLGKILSKRSKNADNFKIRKLEDFVVPSFTDINHILFDLMYIVCFKTTKQ